MKNTSNIYLIGPMGSGKTAIGKQLADTLRYEFYDSDIEIINKTGVTIEHIFDVEKEEGFRKRERQIIKKLTRLDNIVLSTGGGVILAKKNRKRLKKNGVVIYLSTTIDVLVERVEHSNQQNRPLLNDYDNVTEALSTILTEREPLYQSCADIIINTKGLDIKSIISRIVNASAEINQQT